MRQGVAVHARYGRMIPCLVAESTEVAVRLHISIRSRFPS